MDLNNFDISKVVYRPLEEEDIEALSHIGRQSVIHMMEDHPERTGLDMVAMDFLRSLEKSDFCEVAEYEGKPVGVIMGRSDLKNKKKTTTGQKLDKIKQHVKLVTQKEGIEMYKNLIGFDKLDDEIIAETPKGFDGELVYFNMEPELYETNVGYELFEHLREFMKEQGVYNFYMLIHTDNKFNYFKDRHFNLVRTKEVQQGDFAVTVHLYEYVTVNPILG